MAKEEPKKQPVAQPRKKGGKFKLILGMILVCLAMPFMLPTILLLAAGLVPTYVSYGTDKDPEKSGAISVFAMNIAGITPFLIDLWAKGQTLSNAFRILSDTNSWLVILGASAIGQLIIYAVPQAIAAMSLGHSETRIRALRKNLELLKESWGPEVTNVRSVEPISKE
ncbi:MAG: hypothetical protein WC464_05990 [Bdellovibrionales bacterium]